MKNFKMLIAALVFSATAGFAQTVPTDVPANTPSIPASDEQVVVPMAYTRLPCKFPLRIRKGEFETVNLGRWYLIDQVMIQMRGRGDLEILANGVSKKIVRVEGRTSVIVDINDRVNTLIFRHAGNGWRVKVRKVELMPCRVGFSYGCSRPIVINPNPCKPGVGCGSLPGYGSLSDTLYMMQDVLTSLIDLVSIDDLAGYVSPIRAQVGRTLSVANARGDLSQATKDAVVKLVAMLDASQPFIERLKSTQYTFEMGVELEYEKEVLKNMIK